MAYVEKLFNTNFLEYASYVIKDRAIPDIEDGLKPVQRRILYTLLGMDDGKFHKVANVVGHCMRYHPHGDASIYSALVVLANKELFIERQGNFGNIYTGDPPSAARYIECRILPLAKKVLYNPAITPMVESYDGRNREPVVFPSKLPMVVIQGAEGIAVGMSTKILPHNLNEVIDAMCCSLKGESHSLFPDFQTGGLVDIADYQDGHGKVVVRAKLDVRDPKRIVIKELPFGTTTESLIASIEGAVRKGKLRIASITDYTTDRVEIEIRLPRGVHTSEVEDALYAFTDCESSISVNPLVIRDNVPTIMGITELVDYHARQLLVVLEKELKIRQGELEDKHHARTLERIFVEERIYKRIEEETSQEGVIGTVIAGLKPFAREIKRKVTEEDVETLLKIPIRRISLYDLNKARDEIERLQRELGVVQDNLANLVGYALEFLAGLTREYGSLAQRRTEVCSFARIDVRDVALRNLSLAYDGNTGYLGYGIRSGKVLFQVSDLDRVLIIRKSGHYSVLNSPERMFVDKGLLFCGLAERELSARRVFTIVYRDPKNGCGYIKRCRIEQYQLDKSYPLVAEGCKILKLTLFEAGEVIVVYKKRPRTTVTEQTFQIEDFLIKGAKAQGVRLSAREIVSIKFKKRK